MEMVRTGRVEMARGAGLPTPKLSGRGLGAGEKRSKDATNMSV
jgi:hypothetical protein